MVLIYIPLKTNDVKRLLKENEVGGLALLRGQQSVACGLSCGLVLFGPPAKNVFYIFEGLGKTQQAVEVTLWVREALNSYHLDPYREKENL